MIVILAGGVGAAKLLVGIAKVVDEKEMTAIVNTGDDIELHGLHISPDLDIATYSLAGIVDETKGWGIKDDTFHFLEAMKRFGGDEWFNIGDRDLATHIFRTEKLRRGFTLTEVTQLICSWLGVKTKILPMTNEKFETYVTTKKGSMHFEEYMVKHGGKDEVLGVDYFGSDLAKPAEGIIEAIKNAERIIICPSNPIVSIGTILSVKGIRSALKETKAHTVAVCPIIAGSPVKGPADKLMKGLGFEVSAFGVAKLYADFLDTLVISDEDESQKEQIESLGINVKVTNTLMLSLQDKVNLAKQVIKDVA